MGTKYAVVKETAPGEFGGNYCFSVMHETQEEAVREATRLAKKEKKSFIILKSIGIVQPVQPLTEYIVF